MIDIVIPLGSGSHYNDWELKMTLRSIEQHMTGVGRVIVVGGFPHWGSSELVHVPGNWSRYGKAYRIYLKMLAGSERCDGRFIGWSDDTPLLQPMDAEALPVYANSTLAEWGRKSINALYLHIVRNTMKIFPEGRFYNVHTPALYECDKYRSLHELLDWSQDQYLVKSSYFNLYPPAAAVEITDPKIGPHGLPDGPFVSFASRIPPSIMRQVEEKFPNPSRWEA